MLYQAELSDDSVDTALAAFWRVRTATPDGRRITERLARGAWVEKETLDALIARVARAWRIERLAAIDRNILRLGAYELRHEDTPTAVVLDEAIRMARRFGDAESPAFVNGVLDAIAHETRSGGDGRRAASGE